VRRYRLATQHSSYQIRARLPIEAALAGNHLIHHAPKRKNIAARVRFSAFVLLGRHVLRGAEDGSFAGQRIRHPRHVVRPDRSRSRPGQPEIQHFDAVAREHDVGRFNVAMIDVRPVRPVERVDNLGGVFHNLIQRQGTFADARGHGFALQMFEHHEVDTVLFADVVEDADIGMLQAGDGAGLAFKPRP